MSTPLILLSILAFVCVAGLVALVLKRTVCDKTRGIAKLARELGLPLMGSEKGFFGIERGQVFILDVWNGRELNIHHVSRDNGRTHNVSAVLDVPVGVPTSLRMSFTATGWLTQAALLQGLEPVAMGDEAFDRAIAVRSSNAAVARTAMTPELRAVFVRTWSSNDVRDSLSIRDGRIHYEEPGPIKTAAQRNRFIAMASLCHDLAQALDKGAIKLPAQE
jgi:hypothetical protein